MNQEVVSINCPHCGIVLQFVAPDLNRKVKRLEAGASWWWHGDIRSNVKCAACRKDVFLAWFYEHEK